MVLGTADFKPGSGDLVRVVSSNYPSIPNGTIALVRMVSEAGTEWFLEGYEEPIMSSSELEILSYNKTREEGTK